MQWGHFKTIKGMDVLITFHCLVVFVHDNCKKKNIEGSEKLCEAVFSFCFLKYFLMFDLFLILIISPLGSLKRDLYIPNKMTLILTCSL